MQQVVRHTAPRGKGGCMESTVPLISSCRSSLAPRAMWAMSCTCWQSAGQHQHCWANTIFQIRRNNCIQGTVTCCTHQSTIQIFLTQPEPAANKMPMASESE